MENWICGVDYPQYMNEESLQMLSGGYLLSGETPKEAIMRFAKSVTNNIKNLCLRHDVDFDGVERFFDLENRIIKMIWDNEFCPSSPMWANMGTKRGLPISCYGSYVGDSIAAISATMSEIANMSALGGGCSMTLSDVRSEGSNITDKGKSKGVYQFEEIFEEIIKRIEQGETRKGALVSSLDIEHGDFYKHMSIRNHASPSQSKSSIQRMTFAVEVSDSFIEKVWAKEEEALKRWALVLKNRSEKGLPYIFFSDNANKNKPDCYKNTKIKHTNLCTEIMLPNNNKESFVCCVASMNAITFPSWEKNDSIFLAVVCMEAVMEQFITVLEEKMEEEPDLLSMKKALEFAKNHRALGLGILGYHSLLQNNHIPFESAEANFLNTRIFSTLKKKSDEASVYLSSLFGEVEMTKGHNKRHTTLLAVAPTTSNASISGGWSAGIEPLASNYYVVKLAKGKFIRKNKSLEKIFLCLSEEDKEYVWSSIRDNGGSVQHLDEKYLSKEQKEIYKTFKEINQFEIVQQAANRQVYIDQGQSLNLNIPPETPPKMVNQLILKAHSLGIKSLYYQRSESVMRTQLSSILDDHGCVSCEG
jgi:ribonucleoside-diphosphate reductase alpha chain